MQMKDFSAWVHRMNKQEFYSSIDWNAPISRDFLMKLYGYSLCNKDFLVDVLGAFRSHGRDQVQYVYRIFVALEEIREKEILLPISQDLSRQINANYQRKVKNCEWMKRKYLQSLSTEELQQMLMEQRFQMAER
nr:MAG TPA: hypothetical protein [Caudoviricetes sp.]